MIIKRKNGMDSVFLSFKKNSLNAKALGNINIAKKKQLRKLE